MTETTPSIPWNGIPPDPTISGPHWLREKRIWDTGATPGPTFLAEWSACSQRWAYVGVSGTDDAKVMALMCDYIAPCALPDEVAALQAEVRRRGDILRAILEADERGQGLPFAEAMDVAKVAIS
jgi:hypothetical protein